MTTRKVRSIREAIKEALPEDTSLHGKSPDRRHVYTPPSHIKALRLENSLVIGGRGVGKSFWCAALQSDEIRGMLSREVSPLAHVKVFPGYGERPRREAYPDMDTFEHLLSREDVEPYHVWRAVVARSLASFDESSRKIPSDDWLESVHWLNENPEFLSRLLEEMDRSLEKSRKEILLVFDALDRTSSKWSTMDRIVRDLLRVVLQLKAYDRLHGKVFLREDQYEGRSIADFPDASKLTAIRIQLSWGLEDLHGLLWQYLCNAPDEYGEMIRSIYRSIIGERPAQNGDIWTIDTKIKRNREIQKKLFIELAGPWMGKNRRRGHTYTWIVGHLADGRGLASPRSVLAAIKVAAEDSLERYTEHEFPLHYESIKRGVQKASEIRVLELAEDYPWIEKLKEPLNGLVVPCEVDVLEKRWKDRFGDKPSSELFAKRLPPEHWTEGWRGILQDLVKLGIFETMRDGRINMPDLYRIGFGIGRRGGVRPVASMASKS